MYQDRILQHYRAPHGRGILAGATAEGSRKNPLCGDEFVVAIAVSGTRITEVRFQGRGCSISTASASMLTDAVRDMEVRDARALMERLERLLQGETPSDPASLGELIALAGVASYPQRVGCARLPWHALRDALDALTQLPTTSSNSSSIPPVMPPSTL
jgi:nitrogen fixation NifU-like protein